MSRFLAFALALGLATPAVAQPNVPTAVLKHPEGWSIPLPAGFLAPPDAVNGQSITLMLVRGKVVVGACSAGVTVEPAPVTTEVWVQTANSFLGNAEAESRAAAGRSGHTFVRYLGASSVRSTAGWHGFSFWYERTNKNSGQLQASYLAGTMLSSTKRLSVSCSSAAGYLFEPGEYGRMRDLSSLARLD